MFGFPRAGAAQRFDTNRAGASPGTQLFSKTRPCSFYAKGRCNRGQACTFAHGEGELQPVPDFFKTQLCIDFFRNGTCSFGGDCRYAHSAQEIRRCNVPRKQVEAVQRQRAAPARATPSARQSHRRSEIESLQAEIRALQEQVQSRLSSVAIQPQEDDDCDFNACANAWSRQSTAEGPPQQDAELSEDDADAWCGGFDEDAEREEAAKDGEEETEEAVPCELLVRKTFWCLAPAVSGCARRSQSAPP